MGADSKIQWTHHTFNPWIGCTKVSAGCKHCYAEVQTYPRVSKARGLPLWGDGAHRHVTSEANWRKPLGWAKQAHAYPDQCTKCGARLCMVAQVQMGNLTCPAQRNAEGKFDPSVPRCGGKVTRNVRPRVFCASLADVFEARDDLNKHRARLWALVEATPELDWLLLTKRPEQIMERIPERWRAGLPANVWAGTTVEDQKSADERIPHLLRVPAAVRFLSCEPLLERVLLPVGALIRTCDRCGSERIWSAAPKSPKCFIKGCGGELRLGIGWIIPGGESGPWARPCAMEWIADLVSQARSAHMPAFVKQLGAFVVSEERALDEDEDPAKYGLTSRWAWRAGLKDSAGGDPGEWPDDFRVREFPRGRS